MADFIVFERALCTWQLDRRMFNFCLIRAGRRLPRMLIQIFVRLAGAFLCLFGIKAGQRLRWRFLDKAGEGLAARFWEKKGGKLPRIFEQGDSVWLTRYPEAAVKPLADMHGARLYAAPGEDWQELYEKAYWSDEPMLIADAWPSRIKTREEPVYILRGRAVSSVGGYIFRKLVYIVYTAAALICMGAALGLLCLHLGAGYYGRAMFLTYLRVPLIPVLNILPVILFTVLMYFIFNRAWAAFTASAAVWVTITLINYFKLSLRNDPLLFSDVGYAAEGGEMALDKYGITLDAKLMIAVGLCVFAAVLARLIVRGTIRSGRVRIIGAAACAALALGLYEPLYVDGGVYSGLTNNAIVSPWSATGQYISRGFVYSFLHSIEQAKRTPPDGYSEQEARQIMAGYEYTDMPEDKKVNIVAVMLEAYNDFSKFGVPELYDSVYGPLHELEEKSYSGELITNIFAGNTVDTEWCFLTGFDRAKDFRRDTNSYVHYLKEQGYYAEGGHPCYDWFYNRLNVNRYLGFDNYWFYENKYGAIDGSIVGDDILFPDIRSMLDDHLASSDEPYFSFSVTYQNHGPYDSENYWFTGDYVVDNGYTQQEMNIMQNYFAGVANTSKNVAELAEHIAGLDEPVVFIVFGDHNPWMGNNNSVYNMLGVNFDFKTTEGFCNYYCTPYLIFANDAAKQSLGFDFVGDGPRISPCFLMNLFFRLSGLEGNEYMKLANDMMDASPLVHIYELFLKDGNVTDVPDNVQAEMFRRFRIGQYYWRYKMYEPH